MKFDKTKPYGTITGHDEYSFVQDDEYFDAAGNHIPKKNAKPPAPAVDPLLQAKAFLTQILKGGPIRKDLIWREAEKNNQSWDDVVKAKAAMNLKTSFQGSGDNRVELWQMTSD